MLTPLKAIRAKCLECCGGSSKEVRLCQATQCPLHGLRSGHRLRGYKDTPQTENAFLEKKSPENPAIFEH